MSHPVSRTIDRFILKEGELSALLILPLVVVVLYEVIMRYAFNAPTTWGFELTTFLYGIHYMLGLGYTEQYEGHVRVDILTSRLSPKAQAWMNVLTALVIFFPVMTLLTVFAAKYAYVSTMFFERNPTSWAPPVWPFKIIMALSFFFLWLQGLSRLIQNIHALRTTGRNDEV